jgi:hypothetical protein
MVDAGGGKGGRTGERGVKATLTFTLPDDQGEFDAALLGREALTALWEIENHCRAILKHGDPREDMRELCEMIRAMIPPTCLEV